MKTIRFLMLLAVCACAATWGCNTKENVHTVTVNSSVGGTATASPDKAIAGTIINLKAEADEGYVFLFWSGMETVETDEIFFETTTFVMPDNDVVVTAEFEKIFNVLTHTIGNGRIQTNSQIAISGSSIELTAIPDEGWEFIRWTSDDIVIDPYINFLDKLLFDMPEKDVNIYAEFAETEGLHEVFPTWIGGGLCIANPMKSHAGKIVEMTAIPKTDRMFKEWSSEDIVIEDPVANPFTFVMPDKDVTIFGEFVEVPKP